MAGGRTGDWALLQNAHRFLTEHGTPAELLSPAETRRREPALSPTIDGGLWVPEDLVIVPAEATRHLWARSAARGATLREGQKVQSVDRGAVRLSSGEVVRARHVVLAAGYRVHGSSFPSSPCALARGTFSISTPHRISSVTSSWRRAIFRRWDPRISSRSRSTPNPGQDEARSSDPPASTDVASAEVEERVLGLIRERAERFLPGVSRSAVIRQWTGDRPASGDGLPFIGPVPGRPEIDRRHRA